MDNSVLGYKTELHYISYILLIIIIIVAILFIIIHILLKMYTINKSNRELKRTAELIDAF